MFERLKRFFHLSDPPKSPLPALDAQHALGALLVRMALVDGAYLFEEVAEIDRILEEAHGLGPIDAARMRAECERIAFEAPDIDRMAQLIRESVDFEHRRDTVVALWKVALSDGLTDEREAALVDLVEDKLGLSTRDSEAARAEAVMP
ncbi:TerB family tellurite resistance protein [Salipiger sp.]|uniref:tellurite resistance TerB family protein n=1 Tax=Salipiger sp. TaxID=2078585 RepID=UPI003A97619D